MEHYLQKLERSIKNKWDRKAVCNFGGEEFTFGDLATSIEKFHVLFEKSGIKKGDKIALSARNSARWAISYLAINSYEAVVVPILNDFLPDSIVNLSNHSGAVALFTDKELWNKVSPETDKSGLKMVINVSDFTLIDGTDRVKKEFAGLNEAFAAKYPMGFSRANVSFPINNDKDLAVINYTSGTTSAPKGVMLRYECFSATIEFGVKMIPVLDDDKIVSMLPMGHIYGLTYEFLYPLCNGATIYFLGRTPSPSLLLKAMKEVKPFMVLTVPLVMEKIYKSSIKPAISKFPVNVLAHLPFISNILFKKIGRKLMESFGGKCRTIIMGGAALNPEVEKAFHKMKLPYLVGYGMTEAAPLLGFELPEKFVKGSCGKAISCATVRIDSEDPQHIAGEIQAKGTNVCSGYYNNPEANKNAFTEDGYLRTGDLGIIDKDGNIFIKGRSKSMILSANGQNIYPEEVETVVNNQPYVAESVVVDRNSKLVALIYLDADAIKKAKLDSETISDIPENVRVVANRSLPTYSQITKVEVMTAPFEKTPKMSIKRFLYK